MDNRKPNGSGNRTNRTKPSNQKITAYRRPININLGMVFFAVIFIYLCFYFFTYAGQKKISGYQVVSGSLSVNSIYRGLAIREEQEFSATDAGYINYYASEGLKAGCGNLIYTLDATGELADYLNDSDKGSLSDSELNSIQSEIKNFKNEYITNDFSSIYSFKTDLNSLISRYRSASILDNINSLNMATGAANISLVRAETSGIVVYSHDGYEHKTIDSLSLSDLNEKDYHEEHYLSNDLVASGDIVYKMIMDENWYLAVAIEDSMANRLRDESYLQVRFLKTQTISNATCEIKYTGDGSILILGFNNSVNTFATDRFVDIELILDHETGLKIPNSAIEEKEFYLIPADFVTKNKTANEGVLVESYDENGVASSIFTPIEVYCVTDDYYYVSMDSFAPGTYLLKPDQTIGGSHYMDASEIRDNYTVTEDAQVGVMSNEVNEDDQIVYDEYGEMIVIPAGSNNDTQDNSASSESSTQTSEDSTQNSGDTKESVNDSTQTSEDSTQNSEDNAESSNESSQATEDTNQASSEATENSGTVTATGTYYGSKYPIGMTGTLIGVYNMNKGYADFRQITILYQNEEYAIVKPNTNYGLCEYDYIVLDASAVKDNDLIY